MDRRKAVYSGPGSRLIVLSKFQGPKPRLRSFFSTPTVVGVVAQLAEHLLCKQGVAGSNPAGSTIYGPLGGRSPFLQSWAHSSVG